MTASRSSFRSSVPLSVQSVSMSRAPRHHLQDLGNEAYKKKDFDTAIRHYNRALELYDADMTFLTNRAAVFFEQVGWVGTRGGALVVECSRRQWYGGQASGPLLGLGCVN